RGVPRTKRGCYVQRGGPQHRGAGHDPPARSRRPDDPHGRLRPLPLHAVAPGEKSDRYRRLLRRFLENSRDARMASDNAARRRIEEDVRLLPRALRSIRPDGRRAGREPVTPPRIPFIDLRPGEDDAAVRAAIDRVIARGWFV